MLSTLALALATVLTTVALLGTGFAVGCHFGKSKLASLVVSPQPSIEPSAELSLCLEMAAAMESRRNAACQAAARFRESAPLELLMAIDQLVIITGQLSEQLAQAVRGTGGKCAPQATRCTVQPESTLESHAAELRSNMLSPLEMQELTELAGERTESSSSKRRFSYECYQQVFPLHGASFSPNLAAARTVRCHDISVHGISFFWPDEPDFGRVVIALGSDDNPISMLAEVMQSKTVYMHDEIRTLVGCRFIGRYQSKDVDSTSAGLIVAGLAV
jgi:hypothetical protein